MWYFPFQEKTMIVSLLLPDSRILQIKGEITIEPELIHVNVSVGSDEMCCLIANHRHPASILIIFVHCLICLAPSEVF
jgi:hypothetical protein